MKTELGCKTAKHITLLASAGSASTVCKLQGIAFTHRHIFILKSKNCRYAPAS